METEGSSTAMSKKTLTYAVEFARNVTAPSSPVSLVSCFPRLLS